MKKTYDIGETVRVRDLPGLWSITEREGDRNSLCYTVVPKNSSANRYASLLGSGTVLVWAENVSPQYPLIQETLI